MTQENLYINNIEAIEAKVADGRLGEAIAHLLTYTKQVEENTHEQFWAERFGDALLLSAKYKNIERLSILGTEAITDMTLLTNRLTENIVHEIKIIKKFVASIAKNPIISIAMNDNGFLKNKRNGNLIGIEIIIDKNINEYTMEEKQEFFEKLNLLLSINGEIKIKNITAGSIRIELLTNEESAQKILEGIDSKIFVDNSVKHGTLVLSKEDTSRLLNGKGIQFAKVMMKILKILGLQSQFDWNKMIEQQFTQNYIDRESGKISVDDYNKNLNEIMSLL